jgi:hypothetical protein
MVGVHIDVFDDGNEKYAHYENAWLLVRHSCPTRCVLQHRDFPRVLVHISKWKIHLLEEPSKLLDTVE